MGILTNQNVSDTYLGLVKLKNETAGLQPTEQPLTDGLGNELPIQVSQTTVTITGGTFYGDGSNLSGVTVTVANIDDIGDVTITNPQDDESLVYSGGTWINKVSTSANNPTITIGSGDGLTGGGTFTLNQVSGTTITLVHDNTSAITGSTNTGNTVLQSVELDEFGHLTGVTTKEITNVTNADSASYIDYTAIGNPPTIGDGTLTVAVTGLTGGGTFTANQVTGTTIGIAHPTTHPPSIIAETTDDRFVSDAQINDWDAKAEAFPNRSNLLTVDQDLAQADSPTFANVNSNNQATENSHLVRYDQMTSAIGGLDWKDSVIQFYDNSVSLPVAPQDMDRYIALSTANGWTKDQIYEWKAAPGTPMWVEFPVSDGVTVWVESYDTNYTYHNSAWVEFGSTVSHNNTSGLQGGTTGEYYHTTATEHANKVQSTLNLNEGKIIIGDGSTKNIKETNLDITNDVIGNVSGITFTSGTTISWNEDFKTLNIPTGLGPVLQVGQEQYIVMYNDTGAQIDNGKILRPKAATLVGSEVVPTFEYAQADVFENCEGTLVVATMDIPIGQLGIVTRFGRVKDIVTSGFTPGDDLYLSPTSAGDLTNVRPEFPNYEIKIGGCVVSDAVNGEMVVSITTSIVDTFDNFHNGTFREGFDFRTTSNGTTVTGILTPSNGNVDMTMLFSDGFSTLDTSPNASIVLTPGTDDNPQNNFVYIPQSTKVLTLSTSGWPQGIEHIKVAQVVLQSATTTELNGALRNQNWNDHIQGNDGQGHLAHIGERMRQLDSKWDNGAEGTCTIADAGANAYVSATAGQVYQMHLQNFPVMDMTPYSIDIANTGTDTFTISGDGDLTSTFPDGRLIKVKNSTGNDGIYTVLSTSYVNPDFNITVVENIPSAVADGVIGDSMVVVNDFTTDYREIDSLSDITTDASGNNLNNTSFSVVVWGVINKTGEECHLMCNYPTDTYARVAPQNAVDDASNYAVYTIPRQFQGVGFLIARFTLVNTGGDLSVYDTEDLRGRVPNSTAGGGGGGTGVTTYLGLTDTPSTYLANAFQRVNAIGTSIDNVPASLINVGDFNDDGTYALKTSTDTVRVGKLEVDGAASYVDRDGSNNLTLTDSVTGTRTLAQLDNTALGSMSSKDFWQGTQAEYDALGSYDNDTLYFITT